ncbi:hypothetical protein P4S95_10250 [Aneurinibacillus aneurinilyticus]|uniref:hypothetical protein n=1 Tax=Aneurinibacillus aneurinilyticus TaxID=1391 RepID=UPI002E1E5AED|nr:hypothetical protein [Aneurinibacillus aneurinilyticus]
MKKEFKKSALAITVSGLLALTLSACGEPSGVSTGESKPAASQNETSEQKQTAAKEDIKKSAINKDFTVNGLKVKIGEIQVQKDKILVGMTIKNDTKNKLTFYPDQGNSVVGSMQLEANMFMSEGKVSGDIQTGVEKSGVIHFTVPEGKNLDPKTVTSVQLHLGDVFNDKTFEAKPFDQTIELK